jgi:hypothetical protein
MQLETIHYPQELQNKYWKFLSQFLILIQETDFDEGEYLTKITKVFLFLWIPTTVVSLIGTDGFFQS